MSKRRASSRCRAPIICWNSCKQSSAPSRKGRGRVSPPFPEGEGGDDRPLSFCHNFVQQRRDDILSDHDGRVTALIVEASNPLLACSNPSGRLDEALKSLELLVSIDLFRNEVGDLAHYVLPATSWLERPEVPYALQSLAGCCPTPYMIYADAVLEPPPGVRHEWWIWVYLI